MWPDEDEGWEDEVEDPDGEGDEDDGVEDEIAAYAVSVWEEIDGDDELAQASREALVLIAQEALAKKEARLQREESARRRRLARERADQEEVAARQRAERERAEARLRQERWQAECAAREARLAAVERAHTRGELSRREEPGHGVVGRRVARPSAAWGGRADSHGPSVAPALRTPPGVPPVVSALEPLDDEADADVDAEAGWTPSGMAHPEAAPEEPGGFLYPEDRPPLTGADLSAWRARHGLTQEAAADRLGVRQGTVSKAESRSSAALGPALRDALAEALAAE